MGLAESGASAAPRARQVPLLGVEEGEYMLAGHEALLHVAQLQVVHGQHVLLLFLLWWRKEPRVRLALPCLSPQVFHAGQHLGLWTPE